MTRLRMLLLAAVAVLPAMPAIAADTDRVAERRRAPPPVGAERAASAAIIARSSPRSRAEDWAGAAARLDAAGDGPLHGVARARALPRQGFARGRASTS